MYTTEKIRNVAIIAHVDHGKTTLVDALLKQTHTFRDNQSQMTQNLILDSNDQEKERGITINAKQTAIVYESFRINIIDTPGHADFSGEVERTLNMADACILIVDAQEGPMPQTKFVLKKALELNLKALVIINKIDKNNSQIFKVQDQISDLFLELAKDDSQLEYPVFYAIGREGKVWDSMPESLDADGNINVLLDAIISDVPAPKGDSSLPLQMMVNSLNWDNYLGKYAIGKIHNGYIKSGATLVLWKDDSKFENIKIDKIFVSEGLEKNEVEIAYSGDIVHVTGIKNASIGDCILGSEEVKPLPKLTIEEPTLKINLGPNTSPLKGLEAKFSTSRQIEERLNRELQTNIGLKVSKDGSNFSISGRGELHLSVLLESMRREGYEFEVSKPIVINKIVDGKEFEPIEEITIEIDDQYSGEMQQELGKRKAKLVKVDPLENLRSKYIFTITTRALIGLNNILLTVSRGTAQVNGLHIGYEPLQSNIQNDRNGVLIAHESGIATPYSLKNTEKRGICLVNPGENVYEGQIIGINNRMDDLEINIVKEKHLTNMRSKSSDGTVQLTPVTKFTLEQSLDFLNEDELLEVTPNNLRLRKKYLSTVDRKKNK